MSKGANQQKRELAEQDPDLLKPALMKLAVMPRYYTKKVLIKKQNENGEEVYDDSLNEVLYEELGTFGDIVARSRKELLEGYVCPEGKTPYQLDPELADLAALPEALPEFEQTFQASSRERWSKYLVKFGDQAVNGRLAELEAQRKLSQNVVQPVGLPDTDTAEESAKEKDESMMKILQEKLAKLFRRNKHTPIVSIQEVEGETTDKGQTPKGAPSEKSVRDEDEDIIQVRLRKVIAKEERRK